MDIGDTKTSICMYWNFHFLCMFWNGIYCMHEHVHTPLVSILERPSHNSVTDLTVPLHFQFPPTKNLRFAAFSAAMFVCAFFDSNRKTVTCV